MTLPFHFNTDEFGDSPIVNDKYPIPTEVDDVLEPIPSQFAKDQNTSSIFALTLQSNEDFYVVLESDPFPNNELTGESTETVVQILYPKDGADIILAFSIVDGSRVLTDLEFMLEMTLKSVWIFRILLTLSI